MKKIFSLSLVALMLSCVGASAESVSIEDAKDACSCASNLKIIANEVLTAMGDKDEDALEADAELKAKVEPLMEKADGIYKKCKKDLNVTEEAMVSCDAELEGIMDKIEEKF